MPLFWHFLILLKTVFETDASGKGLGTILAQVCEDGTTYSIAYASRTLQQLERNYAPTELEALRVEWAVKCFHYNLYGHHWEIYNDHEPSIVLLNTLNLSGKLAKWGLTLKNVDLVI